MAATTTVATTPLNPLASIEQTRDTPSRQDGVPQDMEDDLRAWGAVLIQRMGCALTLPQRVSATAQVLFQRFWYVSSLRQFSTRDVSVASLYLATKVEEHPVSLRKLINIYDYLLQKDEWNARRAGGGWWTRQTRRSPVKIVATDADVSPAKFEWQPHSYQSSTFYEHRDALVVHEMQLLKRLGFQLQTQLPYSFLVNYLNVLELGQKKAVVQECWSICTDMLQTPLPALFPPHLLAVASIFYLGVCKGPNSLPVTLPLVPHPWYTLFDASLRELQVVCAWLRRLYTDTASRVREEWGGCVELGRKDQVREWLLGNGPARTSRSEG